jgi:hypothetical protein
MSKFTLELITDNTHWGTRRNVLRLRCEGVANTAIIYPVSEQDSMAVARYKTGQYFIRLDDPMTNWELVDGFLSAQLKALELLGVKDE